MVGVLTDRRELETAMCTRGVLVAVAIALTTAVLR